MEKKLGRYAKCNFENSTAPPAFEIPGSATGSIIYICSLPDVLYVELFLQMFRKQQSFTGLPTTRITDDEDQGAFSNLRILPFIEKYGKGLLQQIYNYNRVARCK